MVLVWNDGTRQLRRGDRVFDPRALAWQADGGAAEGRAVTPAKALRLMKGDLRRVPIGIIGPREATAEQCARAEEMGAALADHGLQLLCGGRNGVMEAACKGHAEAGGLPVGLLPDGEWTAANPWVAIPVATGIGPARNAIIARACLCLVAVGGGVGTISEMALGLQFERLVLSMEGAPEVPGVIGVPGVDEAVERIAARLLGA